MNRLAYLFSQSIYPGVNSLALPESADKAQSSGDVSGVSFARHNGDDRPASTSVQRKHSVTCRDWTRRRVIDSPAGLWSACLL